MFQSSRRRTRETVKVLLLVFPHWAPLIFLPPPAQLLLSFYTHSSSRFVLVAKFIKRLILLKDKLAGTFAKGKQEGNKTWFAACLLKMAKRLFSSVSSPASLPCALINVANLNITKVFAWEVYVCWINGGGWIYTSICRDFLASQWQDDDSIFSVRQEQINIH